MGGKVSPLDSRGNDAADRVAGTVTADGATGNDVADGVARTGAADGVAGGNGAADGVAGNGAGDGASIPRNESSPRFNLQRPDATPYGKYASIHIYFMTYPTTLPSCQVR